MTKPGSESSVVGRVLVKSSESKSSAEQVVRGQVVRRQVGLLLVVLGRQHVVVVFGQVVRREGGLTTRGRAGGYRGYRRVGLLRVPHRRRGSAGRDAVRPAERAGAGGPGRGPPGGVPAPARPRSPLPAAPDPVPGQPVGAARAGGAADPGPERGRLAHRCLRPGPAGDPGSAGGPDHGPGADLLRPLRGARVAGRPVLPGRAGARDRRGAARRAGRRPGRHAGRHRRPALLQPGRVALVRGAGLDPDRDDRAPGGGRWPASWPSATRRWRW